MTKLAALVAFAAIVGACTTPASLPPQTSTTTTTTPPTTSTTVFVAPSLVVPSRPFPQHVGYPNEHISPSPGDIDAATRRYYDYWKSHYLVDTGGPHPRGGERRFGATTSEGQGYAMIITVLMGGYDLEAQQLFDDLWRYARAHPSDFDDHLMGTVVVDGKMASVFGGDANMAYALLLAHRQWGSDGAVDYAREARVLIRAIEKSTIGPSTYLPLLGDWVEPQGIDYDEHTVRLSDAMPDQYAAFRDFTSGALWDKATEAMQLEISALEGRWSRLTGLMPGFATTDDRERPAPAPPGFLMGASDGAFGGTAARYPLWAGSHALVSEDPFWENRMRKLSHWAAAVTDGDPLAFRSGYALDGTPLDDAGGFSVLFGGPLAVAAMVNLDQQAWLDALYSSIRERHEGYYEDSVALLSLLVLGGNWWAP